MTLLLSTLPYGKIITELDLTVVLCDNTTLDIFDCDRDSFVGRTFPLSAHRGGDRLREEILDTVSEGKVWRSTITTKTKLGRIIHLDVGAVITDDYDHTRNKLIINIYDVTARVNKEAELQALISHDPLTGIYNRRKFDVQIEHHVEQFNTVSTPFCLLIIDVDDFYKVNDTLGHQAGDIILRSIASRIKQTFKRHTDMVARFGGDEFVVICGGTTLTTKKEIQKYVKKVTGILKSSLSMPHNINSTEVVVTCSIGVGVYVGKHRATLEEIFKLADDAMYASKKAGKNTVTTRVIGE